MDNATFIYQWIRHDTRYGLWIVEIADATDSTYTLRPADMGRVTPAVVLVRVSFTDDAGNYESLTSEPFGPFEPAPAEDCPGGGDGPAPVEVAVEAVPVVVESTAEEYFVLYVRLDPDYVLLDPGTPRSEVPVSVTLGQEPTTTLTDRLSALPKEHYRVEKYLIADPADVDGDCIDDIAELQDPVGMNPVNPAPAVPLADGVVAIPDHETFQTILDGIRRVEINGRLTERGRLESVPFLVFGHYSDRPAVYFANNETHLGFIHNNNLRANPLYWEGQVHGEIVYHPDVIAPNGYLGVYLYSFLPTRYHSVDTVALVHEVLAASMHIVDNNLAYRPTYPTMLQAYDRERASYDDSRVNVMLEEDILRDVDFIPFNRAEGYGFLRVMSLEERPNPRDIVIYETLPNELSRVAGIITTVPQTPLSHVNLRAIQDGVPNAFIRDALDDTDIDDLIGSFVNYTVTEDGYSIREATRAEVDAHHAASRPTHTQTPERDLSVTKVTPLRDIEFDDWNAVGVKAANVAVLRTLGFPDGTVPDGFAVPFYFYDEFMKHNGFYDDVNGMLADPDFQSDFDTQESELKKLRKKIKKGETPQWIIETLTAMHATFPEGQSLRYRSSTNNEDLPSFSGAGLYDSKTQYPHETEEDGISKSLKQVYASLWNFRAFTEREFHRIDHLAAAMGVLVHPNFSDELANGVAVSFNPIPGGVEGYYVNTQIGEDLVTNPEALSVPEAMLLHEDGRYEIYSTSNQVDPGQLLMTDAQLNELRSHLEVIHDEFSKLYGIEAGERFAMEIEFKITSDNVLAIKQARPWVFEDDAPPDNSPATGAPTISGTAEVDETLTASTAAIADEDGLTSVSYKYQWLADDADIPEATAATYTLVDDDEGKTIKVRVSFTDDADHDETLTSAPTAAVVVAVNSPATGAPTIGGTAEVDETLTASTAAIADEDGLTSVSYKYQWLADDADIPEATAATYTLVDDDEGKTIKVRVSFTDDADHDETLTSAPTAAVAEEGLVWSADMLVVEYTSVSIGAASPDLFSNQGGSSGLEAQSLWFFTPQSKLYLTFAEAVPGDDDLTLQVGDLALALQPGQSNYTLQDVEVDWEAGQTIPVRIVRSAATAVVTVNSPATGAPTISGTAQVKETLTASTAPIADEDGLTSVSYNYQWLADDADIPEATGATYTPVDDDKGNTIKVRVSFTDDADHDETLTSAPTAAVIGVPESPRDLAATAERTVIVLSWAPPGDDGGGAVSGYRLEWSADGVTWQVLEEDTAATGYRHGGLQPGTDHHYRVAARNQAGEGPWARLTQATGSEPVCEALWCAEMTVAGHVYGDRFFGFTQIHPGSYSGSTLTPDTVGLGGVDYTVDAIFNDVTDMTVALKLSPTPDPSQVAGLALEIDGLVLPFGDAILTSAGDDRYFVWSDDARFGRGTTPFADGAELSVAVSGTVPTDPPAAVIGVPESPRDLAATAERTVIVLSWAPPGDDGGGAVSGYRLEWSADGVTWQVLEEDTAATGYRHGGLQPGTDHHYRVAARNQAGEGPWARLTQATGSEPVCEALWCAEMTVAGHVYGDRFFGFTQIHPGSYSGSTLTPDTVGLGGVDYTVDAIFNDVTDMTVALKLSPTPDPSQVAGLALEIDGLVLPFGDAILTSAGDDRYFVWSDDARFGRGTTPFADGAELSVAVSGTVTG